MRALCSLNCLFKLPSSNHQQMFPKLRVVSECLPSSMAAPLPRQPILVLSFHHGDNPDQATLIHPRAHTSDALAHITDWLPTLLGLAGGQNYFTQWDFFLEVKPWLKERTFMVEFSKCIFFVYSILNILVEMDSPQHHQQFQLTGTTCGRQSLKVFFHSKIFQFFLLQDLTPLALLLSTTLTWTTRVKRSRCFFQFLSFANSQEKLTATGGLR